MATLPGSLGGVEEFCCARALASEGECEEWRVVVAVAVSVALVAGSGVAGLSVAGCRAAGVDAIDAACEGELLRFFDRDVDDAFLPVDPSVAVERARLAAAHVGHVGHRRVGVGGTVSCSDASGTAAGAGSAERWRPAASRRS